MGVNEGLFESELVYEPEMEGMGEFVPEKESLRLGVCDGVRSCVGVGEGVVVSVVVGVIGGLKVVLGVFDGLLVTESEFIRFNVKVWLGVDLLGCFTDVSVRFVVFFRMGDPVMLGVTVFPRAALTIGKTRL